MSKPLHAGHAADAGALAALGAARGLTGAVEMLDGERGFGNAMSENVDWSAATQGLGGRYNITSVTIKNHGCCGHTFAAIDGILALRGSHDIDPSGIEAIRVGTYRPELEVTGNRDPRTAFEAQFSLPYVVASAAIHGTVRRGAFTEERLRDDRVRALMKRVELAVDADAEQAFPKRRSARIRLEMSDGRVLEHLQPTRKGDPDAPLSDAELNEKYLELAAPVIGADGARVLLDELWSVETRWSVELDGFAAVAAAP